MGRRPYTRPYHPEWTALFIAAEDENTLASEQDAPARPRYAYFERCRTYTSSENVDRQDLCTIHGDHRAPCCRHPSGGPCSTTRDVTTSISDERRTHIAAVRRQIQGHLGAQHLWSDSKHMSIQDVWALTNPPFSYSMRLQFYLGLECFPNRWPSPMQDG